MTKPDTADKTTARPWIAADTFLNNQPNKTYLRQKRYGGEIIADMGPTSELNPANARLIVTAVNERAALLAVAEAANNAVMTLGNNVSGMYALDKALAALALVRGEGSK